MALGAMGCGVILGTVTARAQAPALPVAGFAPADTAAIVEQWPFDRPAFTASSLGGGDGVAEAGLRAIVNAIRDEKFAPTQRPGAIAEGVLMRPPPDSILWPGIGGGEPGAEFPPPTHDPALWSLTGRGEATRHQANARILAAVTPQRLVQAGNGIFFVSTDPGPFAAVAAADLAADSAVALVRAMEAVALAPRSAAECAAAVDCAAIARAEAWAGRSTTDPIQNRLARAVLDAATVGAFLDDPAARARAINDRAEWRQQLGVGPSDRPLGEGSGYLVEPVERLPWEVETVLGALVLAMRKSENAGPLWPVTMEEGLALGLQEAAFRYQDFDLSAVAVTHYRRAGVGGFDLSALLVFLDGSGRRASVSAALSFAIDENAVHIRAAELAQLAPSTPAVRLAIMVAAGLEPDRPAAMAGVVEGEVTPRTASPIPQPYEVFAFVLDRLPPDAGIEIRLGAESAGVAGYSAGSSADLDGWRVARMRGTFALNGPSEFFIKAVYQPGGEVPGADRSPLQLGVLSSHGAGAPPAQARAPVPAAERSLPNLVAGR